jgi:hypothetical protein
MTAERAGEAAVPISAGSIEAVFYLINGCPVDAESSDSADGDQLTFQRELHAMLHRASRI